jgi:hypothetical protein
MDISAPAVSGLHANQARRHVGKPRFDLAA